MGQTHLWLKIGPIKVPRPPPGSDFHETDTRNLIFGVPGPLGAKLRNFAFGGWGAHVCYSLPSMYALVTPAPGPGPWDAPPDGGRGATSSEPLAAAPAEAQLGKL